MQVPINSVLIHPNPWESLSASRTLSHFSVGECPLCSARFVIDCLVSTIHSHAFALRSSLSSHILAIKNYRLRNILREANPGFIKDHPRRSRKHTVPHIDAGFVPRLAGLDSVCHALIMPLLKLPYVVIIDLTTIAHVLLLTPLVRGSFCSSYTSCCHME